MSRGLKGHEHIKVNLSVEKKLLELFTQEYPDINLSYLLELVLQEALKLKGINYELYEDIVLEKKAHRVVKSLKSLVETMRLGKTVGKKDLIDRAESESKLYSQVL